MDHKLIISRSVPEKVSASPLLFLNVFYRHVHIAAMSLPSGRVRNILEC